MQIGSLYSGAGKEWHYTKVFATKIPLLQNLQWFMQKLDSCQLFKTDILMLEYELVKQIYYTFIYVWVYVCNIY